MALSGVLDGYKYGSHFLSAKFSEVRPTFLETKARVRGNFDEAFGSRDAAIGTLKSITHNSRELVSAGSTALLAGAVAAKTAGQPEIAAALAPAVAATTAIEGTLDVAEKLENIVFPDTPLPVPITDATSKKRSREGKIAEQFVRGRVDLGKAYQSPYGRAVSFFGTLDPVKKQRDDFSRDVAAIVNS
jgi:hypothetical protein